MSKTHCTKKCAFGPCERKSTSLGYCPAHYQQMKRGIELRAIYMRCRPPGSPPRIEYDEHPCSNKNLDGPCHLFRGHKSKDGYCNVRFEGVMMRTHRYVWEKMNGKIPEKLEIDHMCRVRSCCNIRHLRLVTRRINNIENSNGPSAICAAKTHCVRGHAFDEVNTIRTKDGHRRCRACLKKGCGK